MTTREDIALIVADAGGDKLGRVARLRALRLHELLVNNLPYTWQPVANVAVIIKGVSLSGNAIEFVVDLTIKGVTKSLSTWIEGKHSTPDYRIINPPLFVDDAAGDVTIPVIGDGPPLSRIGRDDFVAALKKVFIDTFGARVLALRASL